MKLPKLKVLSGRLPLSTQRVLAGVGYVSFFLACFSVFAYLTFPYNRLRDYIMQQVEAGDSDATTGRKRGKGSGYQLKMGTMEPWWLTGLHLTDVELIKTAAKGGEPIRLAADEVWIRSSLLGLFSDESELFFEARIGPGQVNGRYMASADNLEIWAAIQKVDVSKIGLAGLVNLPVGFPLEGKADGSVSLRIPEKPTDATGKAQLKVSGLKIGDGKAKFTIQGSPEGFTIDPIKAGTLQLRIKVDQGVGEVEQLTTTGPDLVLEGSGSLQLAKTLALSRLRVALNLKFSEKYKSRSSRTRALFDLATILPQTKRAIGPDGSFNYEVSGSLTGPRIKMSSAPKRPSRTDRAERAARRARRAARRARRAGKK